MLAPPMGIFWGVFMVVIFGHDPFGMILPSVFFGLTMGILMPVAQTIACKRMRQKLGLPAEWADYNPDPRTGAHVPK